MKKFILYLLSFFFFSIFPSDNDEVLEFPTFPLVEQVNWQPPRILYNKGFAAGTLIKTIHGYQPIETLKIGDIVCGADKNHETIVTDIFYNDISQFVRLNKHDYCIEMGCEQLLFSKSAMWTFALCISPYDTFFASNGTEYSFDKIEIIEEKIRTYCITVQHHIFTATALDLIVHNSAMLAAPSIMLSFVRLTQPVLVLLGTTTSLSHFSSHNPVKEQGNAIVYQASPEKNYFDARYQKLCKLKQNFLSIHAAVKSIKCQFQDHYTLLSYQQLFNNNFTQTFNITAQQEAELDFEQRLQLAEIRKKILQDLEDEICNIQIAVGLFVNEIIARKNATIEYYNTFVHNNQDPLHQCLKLPNNITYNKILNYYIFTAIGNMLLEEIDIRNNECLLLNQCFHHKNEIFHTTTNILQVLDQTYQEITQSQSALEKTKLGNHIKIQNVIIYFKHHPTHAFPNITPQITNTKKELHHYLQNKKCTLAGQSYPKINPQQDPEPDDDDDREIPRIYVGVKYHGKNATAIKSAAPKNGQSALDVSLPIGPRIRVGISENQIVILARTLLRPQGGSEWHGYATTWNDLEANQESDIIKTLKKNGLVKNNGKII